MVYHRGIIEIYGDSVLGLKRGTGKIYSYIDGKKVEMTVKVK